MPFQICGTVVTSLPQAPQLFTPTWPYLQQFQKEVKRFQNHQKNFIKHQLHQESSRYSQWSTGVDYITCYSFVIFTNLNNITHIKWKQMLEYYGETACTMHLDAVLDRPSFTEPSSDASNTEDKSTSCWVMIWLQMEMTIYLPTRYRDNATEEGRCSIMHCNTTTYWRCLH